MANQPEQPTGDREQALLRLKKRRDLQGHAVAFLVVNSAVWALWAVTGAGDLWPAWITGIWAIGLVLDAWDVRFRKPITEADVRQEIERLHPQQ